MVAALIPAITDTLGMAPELIQLLDKKGQQNQITLAQEQARTEEARARAAEAAGSKQNPIVIVVVAVVAIGVLYFLFKSRKPAA